MPTMTFPIPHAARTSLVACLVGLAALAAGGCSGAGTQPPNAYFTSTLGSITTPGATGMCNRGEPEEAFWTIGTEDNPVSNGGSFGGATITVGCVVTAMGPNTFGITLEAYQGESYGISISGTVTNSTAAQPNITATFNELNVGSYSSSDCMLTLTNDTPTPITAGRIWASVSCPLVTDPSIANGACAASVSTLIFQNCQE